MSNFQGEFQFDENNETDGSSIELGEPLVLLLGWVDHEGIVSSLKSSGRPYKKKLMESTPENWNSICDYFVQYSVSCVIVKLNANVCRLLELPQYATVREDLFTHIGSVPNAVFAFEDILKGRQEDAFRAEYKPYPASSVLEAALEFINGHGISVIPYRTSAEVTVTAESFLTDTERNLIFRLYVPKHRLWASETDRFLQLFQDYLSKVDGLAVRLDQRRTDFGAIYEFHGQTSAQSKNLTKEFQDFSQLMDLCVSNIEAAANVLAAKNLNPTDVTGIVTRYAKEARRLQVDIKHEAEIKLLSIRQRVESELVDLALTPTDLAAVSALIDAEIPQFRTGLTWPLQMGQLASPASSQPTGNITYNFKYIGVVKGIVADEVNGDQHIGPELREILEAIRQHAGPQLEELETAVYEVADNSGREVDRVKATQKLKAFLIGVGKRTGDVAFSLLQKYLEGRLGL